MPTQEGSELVVLTRGQLCPPSRGHLAMSGDKLVVMTWEVVRDSDKHPTVHRPVPRGQEGSGPNVSGPEVEKFCSPHLAVRAPWSSPSQKCLETRTVWS